MAIYHCSTKPLARSSGRSAVAAAAYRSGDCLTDERQGLEHDYTRRSGVLHSELVLPADAGEWTRSELWNAAEQAEKRKDGRTAREWEVALPDELSREERRQLAVSFAQDLAERYGCAVDVAVHAPDREGDQRNWHAHLLATTRKVSGEELADKCVIELSDAKRLFLGYEPARKEIEEVREVWADRVNEYLERAGQEDRVDHRSLAVQRGDATRNNELEKAAELDREPQIKLGWKVVQMERRGEHSDRADQFHKGKTDNTQRKAAVIDIGELRARLASREAAARQQELDRVEDAFRGQSHSGQLRILEGWRYLGAQEKPDVEHARAIWEQDRWDPDAKAWRETSRTLEWEKEKVQKTERAVEDWYRHHPIKALLVRAGIQGKPRDLESLEQEHHQAERFLAGSQNTLEKLERSWTARQPEYEQKLETQGRSIKEARENLKVIEKNPEHFKEVFDREHNAFQEKAQQRRSKTAQRGSSSRFQKTPEKEPERDPDRGHDRDDGWSR
jgi:MobA/MobL family